jgi:hypothetical protein
MGEDQSQEQTQYKKSEQLEQQLKENTWIQRPVKLGNSRKVGSNQGDFIHQIIVVSDKSD